MESASAEPKGGVESGGVDKKPTTAYNRPATRISRKRTKTGCLTCRKRRIKCGEERPICKNCVKSKRVCEGYTQRVVFKPPNTDFRLNPAAAMSAPPYNVGLNPSMHMSAAHQQQHLTQSGSQVPLTPIRPRPVVPPEPEMIGLINVDQRVPGQVVGSFPSHDQGAFPLAGIVQSPDHIQPEFSYYHPNLEAVQQPPLQGPTHHPQQQQQQQQQQQRHAAHHNLSRNNIHKSSVQDLQQNVWPCVDNHLSYTGQQQYRGSPSTYSFQSAFPEALKDHSQKGSSPRYNMRPHDESPASEQYSSPLDGGRRFVNQPDSVASPPWHAHTVLTATNDTAQAGTKLKLDGTLVYQVQATASLGSSATLDGYGARELSPTQVLEEAAREYEDDDYWDVQSEDDYILETDHGHDLGTIMALHRAHIDDLSIRRYDAFIYEGILDQYRPERVANPLRNPQTMRVFAHFVDATGPGLTIFTRHPRNTSVLYTKGPVPASQQGLWTYTLPMMALHHQGLLHAMLALSSLHIAKLQNACIVPSLKHYAYSLKRMNHCLKHPQKRHQVPTLAATLLLGFYEILTADHLKWSSHLLGANKLIGEIDFAGMTKDIRRLKSEREVWQRGMNMRGMAAPLPETTLGQPHVSNPLLDNIPTIDEGLVSTIIGRKLRYDEYGQVIEEEDVDSNQRCGRAEVDLNDYQVLQDLYWWYCHQDVYQSIVSGNPLLMDYSKFSACPPRALVGKVDAVYGTFDHLILLLARVAEFSARDRKRKLKRMELFGGRWVPPPEMGGPPVPPEMPGKQPVAAMNGSASGNAAPPHAHLPPAPQVPFYGMAPPPPPAQLPSSYAHNPYDEQQRLGMETPIFASAASFSRNKHMPQTRMSQPPRRANSYSGGSGPADPATLAAETAAAIEEWHAIQHAFNVFQSHLSHPTFQPLPAEYHQPMPTPFGLALSYRSYDINCIWAIFHMGIIILTRSHPHMPPAAMMAAGVAAKQTAYSANEIGRIAAGLPTPVAPNAPLPPALGAALCESTMPLFFAGIQYQEPDKRAWLVRRILDIEARTGWGSAGMIARGCETAWIKAHKAGMGPEYVRQKGYDYGHPDERVAGRDGGVGHPVGEYVFEDEDGDAAAAARGVPTGHDARMRAEGVFGQSGQPDFAGHQAREQEQKRRGQQERHGQPSPEHADNATPTQSVSDRRFIHLFPETRLHWAIGLLSEDQDIMAGEEA